MKTALFGFLLLVSLSLTQAFLPYWRNEYDKPLNYDCPNGQIISYLHSIHDNRFQDRIWEISCRAISSTSNCFKAGWVNDWDKSFFFTCPGNTVLAGIESYHDNTKEDRKFKFTCCTANNKQELIGCQTTAYLNQFDGPLTLNVTEGFGIFKVYSYNDDGFSDRRFAFRICQI